MSDKLSSAFGMGLAVTFVTMLSGTLTWLVDDLVLTPLGLEITRYIAYIVIIAGAVQLVEMYVRKFVPALYEAF